MNFLQTTSTILDQLSSNLTVDRTNSMCNTTYARLVLVEIHDHRLNFTFTFNEVCYLLWFIISRVVSMVLISLVQTKNATWQDGNTTFQYETRVLPGYDHSDEHGK